MLFNKEKFDENLSAISFYAKEINHLKKERTKMFHEHKDEIIKCREDLLDINNREDEKNYLRTHRVINEFNTKEALINIFEEQINKIKFNTSCFTPNKKNILTMNNMQTQKILYDLETGEFVDISKFNHRQIAYLKDGLERVNSYIGEFNLSEAFVLKTIYYDLKRKNKNLTNSDIYDEYKFALRYDNSCKDSSVNLNEELIKLNHDYYNNKIDKETFDLRTEMLKLIESDNIDNLYLNYTKISKKKILVDAYYDLSNNENNYYNKKIRTRNPIINMAVLYSKYLDNNDKKNSSN